MAKREKSAEAKPAEIGRPPFAWTPEIEDRIFDLIMDGQAIRQFLRHNREEGLPEITVFYKRMRDDESFAKRYARAKEFCADQEFEETKEIADNGSNDWMEVNDPDNPGYRINGEHVQRSKLRVDVRKWRAAKLAPKKYGDRIAMEHEGPDGGAIPVAMTVTYVDPPNSASQVG